MTRMGLPQITRIFVLKHQLERLLEEDGCTDITGNLLHWNSTSTAVHIKSSEWVYESVGYSFNTEGT